MKSIFKRCFSLIIVFVLMLSSNTTINLVAIGIYK